MLLKTATGPGVNDYLLNQLNSWGIESLTDIQQKAISSGVANGKSMIVCAPTSSGKTLVGEIAVLSKLLAGGRAIYLVSHKALADQKYEDFQRRFGEKAINPISSVGISTGDRDEGDFDAQLLVSTYEKALGLIVSGLINPQKALIVADELQILGDQKRGPNIESLCTILKQKNVEQFIALTATISNPDDLAGWLVCDSVVSYNRDVKLKQQIWYQGNGHETVFGETDGTDLSSRNAYPTRPIDAVNFLLQSDYGPVLVFTESRKEAIRYANEYSRSCSRSTDGLNIAEQLDLFSEPTESSEQLKQNVEKNVAFHTADLTSQERAVIEKGFLDSKFEVCFATSTLAAGVNFPFKTVLFPKLTYQWREETHISIGDYRNMSGRAGRLGMHDVGFSVLLAQNSLELSHANRLVSPDNEKVNSKLVSLSMRRSVLMLISSGIVDQFSALNSFFENTLYWYQTLENNPLVLSSTIDSAKYSIEWLLENDLVEQHGKTLLATPLGKAASISGLMPTTVVDFVELFKNYKIELENQFEEYIVGLLHWVCCCPEFQGDSPSRFLVSTNEYSPESAPFILGKKLFHPLDRTNTNLIKCVHALSLYVFGEQERKISFMSKIPSGQLHRLAIDVAWILDGLHKVSCVTDIGCSQQFSNKIAMLSRRVRWGAPAEILDLIRVAERHGVPGFGRQRAMILLQNGLTTFEEILNYPTDKLIDILHNKDRAIALLEAVSNVLGIGSNRLANAHKKAAKELGLEQIVDACNGTLGTDYEEAILKLLKAELSWTVKAIDDGKRQNVPDILIKLDDIEILIECKTCTKKPALIKKEEAFAVLQKAADFDRSMKRVSLGKPAFDEHSKSKAQAAHDITLVEHHVFMEGLLRVHTGSVTPMEFLKWLGTPGISEIDRLNGKATFSAT